MEGSSLGRAGRHLGQYETGYLVLAVNDTNCHRSPELCHTNCRRCYLLSEGGETPCEVGRKPIALDVGIRTRILLWAAVKQHLNGVNTGIIGTGDIFVGCIADKDRFLGGCSECRQQRVEGGGVGFAGGKFAGHQRRIEQRFPAEILDLRPLGTNRAVRQEADAVVGTQLSQQLFGIGDRHKRGGDGLAVGRGQLIGIGVGGIAGE